MADTPPPNNVQLLFSPEERERRRAELAKQRAKHRLVNLLAQAKEGLAISNDADTQAYWSFLAARDREGAKSVIRRVREAYGLEAVLALLNGVEVNKLNGE